MTADRVFDRLTPLDPHLARTLAAARDRNEHAFPEAVLAETVNLILAAYEQEIHLGAAVADGCRRLLANGPAEALAVFGREMRGAADHSAALGTYLADVLPAVLLARETALWESFQKAVAILLTKGDYLIRAPLGPLPHLIAAGEDAARAYLELLQVVFDRPLSYNRCQYLGNLLPRALREFPAHRRSPWIRQLTRLARCDLDLIEPYLEGLAHGLDLLSPSALPRFVDAAMARRRLDQQDARRFLALRSGRGREILRSLQTAAVLRPSLGRLNRYVAARTGRAGRIRPMAAGNPWEGYSAADEPRAGTDGVYVYLPQTVDCLATREANTRLLTCMAKFEAGLIEYGTFAFDLERARDLGCLAGLAPSARDLLPTTASDFTAFNLLFDDADLARDLFTLYEHARVRLRLARAYPGLTAGGLPLYQEAMLSRFAADPHWHALDACYAVLALDMPPPQVVADRARRGFVETICAVFAGSGPESMRVEHCAGLVATTYGRFQAALAQENLPSARMTPPYRMTLQPALIDAAGRAAQQEADRLKTRLEAQGVKLYRGDLRELLLAADGSPPVEDILALADRAASPGLPPGPDMVRLFRRPDPLADPAGPPGDAEDTGEADRITWLKEWNAVSGDYLHDHVRVRDRRLAGTDTVFFDAVLERSSDLVRRIRRSFELLRPEGLGLLRQWTEGDDFDYRALLDFALDRKAGRLPSDRLYIKRVKQRRDVAVLLLVDLSRSTSNIVEGSTGSVLDVTKEALVLFTQALEVVGDAYAMAGYSGTGRLGVDYFRIKDFDEPLGDGVRATLSALAPQRSTRMGAAVRRAALALAARENRVRLLLMIGDGFPNDAEYKGDYAVQDTRRAIAEARSSGIITQAITVNLPTSPQLDNLYGPVRHTVISRIEELPDKLLRLYGALTRA